MVNKGNIFLSLTVINIDLNSITQSRLPERTIGYAILLFM